MSEPGREHSDQKHASRRVEDEEKHRENEQKTKAERTAEKWAGREAQLQNRRFGHRKVSTQRVRRCGRYADRSGPPHTHARPPFWQLHSGNLHLSSTFSRSLSAITRSTGTCWPPDSRQSALHPGSPDPLLPLPARAPALTARLSCHVWTVMNRVRGEERRGEERRGEERRGEERRGEEMRVMLETWETSSEGRQRRNQLFYEHV